MTTIKADPPEADPAHELPVPGENVPVWLRWLLIAFGWLMVALGVVGVVVPVLPTTVFLIVALWAFSKSSQRFQLWIWTHPRFGPSVRAWHRHGVIPVRAKALAVMLMSLSFIYITAYVARDWILPAAVACVMVPAALYICTRPSYAPDQSVD